MFGSILGKLDGILARLREVASSHGVSVSQIAEAYAIAKGVLPIVGVTKEYQVEEAAKTTELALSAEEISSFEAAADKSGVTSVQFWESKME